MNGIALLCHEDCFMDVIDKWITNLDWTTLI